MRTTSEETKAVTDPSSHSSTLKAFSFARTDPFITNSLDVASNARCVCTETPGLLLWFHKGKYKGCHHDRLWGGIHNGKTNFRPRYFSQPNAGTAT